MSYGQQKHTQPQWVVDPKLYENYELSHEDVLDDYKGLLIPLMERLESGELVDVNHLAYWTHSYLMMYYASKYDKTNPIRKLSYMYELRPVGDELHKFGYLHLPTIEAPQITNARINRQETMARKEKVLKWFELYWFLRTFIKLFV